MSFQRRASVVGVLGAMALIAYGTARLYSYSLVVYVVEQSLIQKAPPAADPVLLRKRLNGLLAAIPDRKARLAKVLAISQDLEKVQMLTLQELELLLSVAPGSSTQGPP